MYQGSLLRATHYVSREEEQGLLGTELHIKIQLTTDNPSPQHQFEPRANSKNLDFPLDFLQICTVILPSVTRTLDNLNLPLTGSNFCFSFTSFLYSYTLDNLNHVLSAWRVAKKRQGSTAVRNREFIFFIYLFCFFAYFSKYRSIYLLLSLKLSVHDTCIPLSSCVLISLFPVICFELLMPCPWLS